MVAKRITKKTIKKELLIITLVKILIAAFFFIMGVAKIYGDTNMVMLFDMIGAGKWLMYVVGLWEIAAAILLFVKGRTHIGATMLAVASFGAFITQLTVLSGAWFHPILLLAISLYLCSLQKDIIIKAYKNCLSK